MPHRTVRAALALAFLASGPALAQDAAPRFQVSGYGTAGVIHSSNDRADYLVDAFKPDGPGRTRDWSFDADSRLGLQLTANLTDRISAVVQVLSQQRHDGSYRPVVEWANVKLRVTPDLSVRAGRVVLPIFMVTDTRRVGFANPWIRPPVEVYSLVPVTSNDGMDASWRHAIGPATNTLQVTAGRSDSRFPSSSGFDAGEAEVRKLIAVADSLELGHTTLRLSYGQANLTIAAFRPFSDAFRAFGPQGIAIGNRYAVDDRRVRFVGVGATYDPGGWFATGEWARFDTNSILGDKSAWYASGGYRLGRFTPYATFARLKAESQTSDPGLNLAVLPPQLQPTAAFLNAGLNAQLRGLPVQDTASVGLRWDVHRNAAVKLQYDHVRLGAQSRGTFGNASPDFQPGSRVRLFSAAVDFVF